jgi:DNA-binding MarR family transcriptional regulator
LEIENMTRTGEAVPPQSTAFPEIEAVGAELRAALRPLLVAAAGPRPSPVRLARAMGLDKSLASRLVRAARAATNLDLMNIVPSPAGLRILAELAGPVAPAELIAKLLQVTDRFAVLLESTPGGRAAIDALISESSRDVRERREHIAKQASFKAMSFLLGHFCDVHVTTLFLVPSANGRTIDGIEIHRRIGLRRLRPSTPLALLSLATPPETAPPGDVTRFETLEGPPGPDGTRAFLMPEFSSQPLSGLQVVQDSNVTTLVIPGTADSRLPSNITSAFRIINGWPRAPLGQPQNIRGYVLHIPTVRLVRDLFVAESLFQGAHPRVSFLLPGPRVATHPPREDGTRHFTEVDLGVSIEQLPAIPAAASVPGVADQVEAIRHVLERSGHGTTRFRGWRCSITYPVPLIEMMWWLGG